MSRKHAAVAKAVLAREAAVVSLERALAAYQVRQWVVTVAVGRVAVAAVSPCMCRCGRCVAWIWTACACSFVLSCL
jgi:hypothetical protein